MTPNYGRHFKQIFARKLLIKYGCFFISPSNQLKILNYFEIFSVTALWRNLFNFELTENRHGL